MLRCNQIDVKPGNGVVGGVMQIRNGPDTNPLATALARCDWAAAHALCIDRLQHDANDAAAFAGLATIAEAHGNIARAAELFGRAGADIDSARTLLMLSRQVEAGAAADRALANVFANDFADPPRDAAMLDRLGVVLGRLERHDDARRAFEAATTAAPRHGPSWRNLANTLQFLGDFDGAEAAFARAIACDPGDDRAWVARVQLRRQTAENDPGPALRALWERRGNDPDTALRLGHALAKTAEDLGDPDVAMQWLAKGKAAKAAAVAHDPDATDRLYAAAADTCLASDLPATAATDAAPIFVTGLPRTGTTLVDRIISSHPAVVSIGESPAFSLAVKRASGTRSNRVLDVATLAAARDLPMAALGFDYLAQLPATSLRTLDKMPLNSLYSGLIHRSLPAARIIRLRRHPLDTALANYRQLFATTAGYYDHAYRLEHIARWIVAFERLAGHWRAVLPADRYCELAYEALVADQEGETRRLLAFCGLDWDPRCLAFHENAAPVSTASAVQVRAPLHGHSVGIWRRFVAHMGPAIDILHAAGLIDAEGNATTICVDSPDRGPG